MDENFRTNLLAGFFLILAVVGFSGLMVYLQGIEPDPVGARYTFIFDDAPGVRRNAAVTISGKRVGRVEEVQLRQSTREGQIITRNYVSIRLDPESLDNGVSLRKDATAKVVEKVFGNPLISLNPGSSDDLLPPDAVVEGESPTQLGDLLAAAKDIPGKIDSLLASFVDRFENNSPFDSIDRALQGATNVMNDVQGILERVHPMLDQVGPTLENANGLITDLRTTNTSVQGSIAKVDSALDKVNTGIDEATGAITDSRSVLQRVDLILEENRVLLSETLASLRNTTASADGLMADRVPRALDALENVANNVAEATSALESMLRSNQGDLRLTMINLRRASDNVNQMVAKLRRDPSVLLWGTDEADNSADRSGTVTSKPDNNPVVRDTGRLGPRERTSDE